MAAKDTVKLNKRQWDDFGKHFEAQVKAQREYEVAAQRLAMYVEVLAGQADIDSGLSSYKVDPETRSLVFAKPQEQRPQLVGGAGDPA